MSDPHINRPLPVQPAPDPVDPTLAPLLSDPIARAWSSPVPAAEATKVRGRLMQRIAASVASEASMVTVRRDRAPRATPAPGVLARTLYECRETRQRPGEPLRVRLLELAPGARIKESALDESGAMRQRHREWLVVAGRVQLGGEVLALRDYCVSSAGMPTPDLSSEEGGVVFLRESMQGGASRDGARFTVLDRDAGWPDFAPGIQRRVLWAHGTQAALLYYAQPGAQVPVHSHGHDEECLMVQGELFLDDVLLREGDYQLAPAGSGHRITETDTGVVIYAHGDLDLRFVS
jgi:hypothetical protein